MTYFVRLIVCLLLITSSANALPMVIAHRGGGQNFPENTLLAFEKCVEMGCDALELDVQVTKDGVVVVYHPGDLSQWTEVSGPVALRTWDEIKNLGVPLLEEVLEKFPKTVIIVDLKSLPAEALIKGLIKTISDEDSIRLIFYSTNSEHLELLHRHKPHWRTFEDRDMSRQRLLELNQTGQSELAVRSNWIGFELKRKMTVTEVFVLGKGTSTVEFQLWSPKVVDYLKGENPHVSLVLFGINTAQDWEQALNLGVDAVYTDNPKEIVKLRCDAKMLNELQAYQANHAYHIYQAIDYTPEISR